MVNAYEIVVTCGSPKHKEPRKLHTYSYEPELHDQRWVDVEIVQATKLNSLNRALEVMKANGERLPDADEMGVICNRPSSERFNTRGLVLPSHIRIEWICGYRIDWEAERFYRVLDRLRDNGLHGVTAQSAHSAYERLKQSTGSKLRLQKDA